MDMWETIDVRWDFRGRLCGSVPMKKELVRPWLEARNPQDINQAEKEVLETLDEAQERVTLGFQKDEEGLFVRGGTVKAHLKDCSNIIKDILKIKALRAKVANKIYVQEDRIHLHKEGQVGRIAQKPDGNFDQPIHVITPRGPRNSLKTIGYLEGIHINFTLKLLQDKEITREILEAVFQYGEIHGYGGERGMGYGRYVATIL